MAPTDAELLQMHQWDCCDSTCPHCKLAGAIGDQIADAVLEGRVVPPEIEPGAETESNLADALDALRGLYDVQNGPPLIREETAWRAAMQEASYVLHKHGK